MSFANYLRNGFLNSLRGTPFSVSALKLSLHSGNPGRTGANEISGGDYVRQPVSFNGPADGVMQSSAKVSFTGMPACTVTHYGLWDTQTPANFLWGGPSGVAPKPFTANDPATDLISCPGHSLNANDRVEFDAETGGSLPGGLSGTTLHYVISDGLTADAFKVSLTQGGAAVDLTSKGQGQLRKVVPTQVNLGETYEVDAGNLRAMIF